MAFQDCASIRHVMGRVNAARPDRRQQQVNFVLEEVAISQAQELASRSRHAIASVLLDGQQIARHCVRERELLVQRNGSNSRTLHMKVKYLLIAVFVSMVMIGSLLVRAYGETKPSSQTADPRLDKLIEQNEKILKNQDEILKQLDGLKQDLLQVRRRAS